MPYLNRAHGAEKRKGKSAIKIVQATGDKKIYRALLLLAGEQESMVDCYLGREEMFVLKDGGVRAECVVTKEAEGRLRAENIAVRPDNRRKGYGRALIESLFAHYADCGTMFVGTGESPATLNFYRRYGFSESRRVRNFFTDHYNHPIYEDGWSI